MSDAPREPRREDFQTPSRNPFGNEVATRPVGALANAEQQRSIAEVQARMIIARSNPRDPIRAMDLILRDCTRASLAKGALYQYARGGSAISGPSIRLAEAIAQRWGNIASGIKELSRTGGYSECVAYAWDLESGYYDERQFQVRHWRDTKQGGYAITDERDIYELIANMGQRRKRAVMLTVIPGDVVEAAVEQCESTLKSSFEATPEYLAQMLAAFAAFNITKQQIEKRCQCHIEAIRPAQIVQLNKIYTSLKDGMSDAQDWFEVPNGAWASVEETHAHTDSKPAETRAAPRKAAAKKGAAQPQEDSIPFDRWNEEGLGGEANQPPKTDRTTPPADATRMPASAPVTAEATGGEPQTPPPVADPMPATTAASTPEAVVSAGPSASGAVPFTAWLMDPDGTEAADEDGVIPTEPFTDPVVFARAFVEARGNLFPLDIEAFEAANKAGIAAAMIASTEVAPLLISEPPPAEPTLPMSMPIDPAFIALDSPGKLTKPAMTEFNKQLVARYEQATTIDGIDHINAVNEPIYSTFPGSFRLASLALYDNRRRELTPAPTGQMAETMEQLALDMVNDIHSLTTGQSCDIWEASTAVKARMLDLATNDPVRHTQVVAALRHTQLMFAVKACTTKKQATDLSKDVNLIERMRWLREHAPLVRNNTAAEMDRHVAALPE